MDSYSKVVGIGEIENFNKNILYTCGEKVSKCDFWSDIFNKFDSTNLKIRRGKFDFLLNRDRNYIKADNHRFEKQIATDSEPRITTDNNPWQSDNNPRKSGLFKVRAGNVKF